MVQTQQVLSFEDEGDGVNEGDYDQEDYDEMEMEGYYDEQVGYPPLSSIILRSYGNSNTVPQIK